MKVFKRKRTVAPRDEVIEKMQKRGLCFTDCKVLKVLFSPDKIHRFVILQSEKGFLTYRCEELRFYGEEELEYFSKASFFADWQPLNDRKPIFDDMDKLLNELTAEKEYKKFFEL